MGEEGAGKGVGVIHRVVLSLRGMGMGTSLDGFLYGVAIQSTHPRHSLSDFPYEKPDRHHLPDDCRASWKCGGELGKGSVEIGN